MKNKLFLPFKQSRKLWKCRTPFPVLQYVKSQVHLFGTVKFKMALIGVLMFLILICWNCCTCIKEYGLFSAIVHSYNNTVEKFFFVTLYVAAKFDEQMVTFHYE